MFTSLARNNIILIDKFDQAIQYSKKKKFPILLLDPTIDVSVTHLVLSFDYINSGKNIHIQVKQSNNKKTRCYVRRKCMDLGIIYFLLLGIYRY